LLRDPNLIRLFTPAGRWPLKAHRHLPKPLLSDMIKAMLGVRCQSHHVPYGCGDYYLEFLLSGFRA
jgi:hypothetical protein